MLGGARRIDPGSALQGPPIALSGRQIILQR